MPPGRSRVIARTELMRRSVRGSDGDPSGQAIIIDPAFGEVDSGRTSQSASPFGDDTLVVLLTSRAASMSASPTWGELRTRWRSGSGE